MFWRVQMPHLKTIQRQLVFAEHKIISELVIRSENKIGMVLLLHGSLPTLNEQS